MSIITREEVCQTFEAVACCQKAPKGMCLLPGMLPGKGGTDGAIRSTDTFF